LSQPSLSPTSPQDSSDSDGSRDVGSGYGRAMSQEPSQERVQSRAELLPEEQAAGSDDPELQARAILAESDERTEHPERTRHESNQTPDEA
jgi:hypothetical protein